MPSFLVVVLLVWSMWRCPLKGIAPQLFMRQCGREVAF